MKKILNIGLIGHKFMGKAHSHALRDVSMFFDLNVKPVMKVICGLEDDIAQIAEKYGWERYEKSWENVVSDPEIDIIDISSPGYTHKDIAIAAAQNRKHIFCEKPLATSLEETRLMYEAAEKYNVKHMVDFNYRCVPAIQLAKKIITDGKLGKIYCFKGFYQQDWALSEDYPLLWRMEKEKVGLGPAEAGSHIIDLARFLVGEFSQVTGIMETFIKERYLPGQNKIKKPVTTDDESVFISKFANGALGVFETSRISAGKKNALTFEINGSKGTLRFDLERLNELNVYFTEDAEDLQGFRNIMVTEPSHKYIKNWWPPGHVIGWEHTFIHQYYEFLKAIAEDYKPSPNFYDGVKAQEIIEAISKADSEMSWVKID